MDKPTVTLAPSDRLINDLAFNSLKLATLTIALEDELDLERNCQRRELQRVEGQVIDQAVRRRERYGRLVHDRTDGLMDFVRDVIFLHVRSPLPLPHSRITSARPGS